MIDSAPMPLLATKLFKPALREKLVIRPRLHYILSENDNARLVLVTAPAGSGKTTLVTSWLAKKSKATAWLSLDENDNDPLIFLSYVAAALHEVDSGVCETIRPLLLSPDPPPVNVLLTYFINDLTCLKEPVILVLDDYHVITSAEVDEVTEFLIEHRPPNLQIFITGRRMPAFSVSRWRARNEIVEISVNDLQFNYDESWHFLQDVMQLDISDTQVAALRERTEGWVTGLQLAALSLRSQPGSGGEFIHEMSGDDRLIGDYLVDEVIEQQPEEVRKFLVQTSILRRLSAPLCNALLEIADAQEQLNYLERANLFLIPLDNRRVWYRYHHLFAEMLRARLEQKRLDIVPVLYQRAIQWHVANDLITEAVDYAIVAEDYEQAAELIEKNLDHFQTASQHKRLQRWAESISDTVLKEHDVLWSQYILSLFYFADFDIALDTLHRFWHEGPVPVEKAQIVRAIEFPLLAAITLHTTLNAPKVRELTQEALVIMPAENQLMRGIALGHYGSASMHLGDLDSARQYLDDALHLIGGVFSWAIVTVFRMYLAETLAIAGELREAFKEYDGNQKQVYQHGTHEGNTFAGTLIGLGMLYYEWNRLEEADELIRQGGRLADVGRLTEIKLQACQAYIKLYFAGREAPDIRERLDQIEVGAEDFQNPPVVMERLAGMRSLLAFHEGNQTFAKQWADKFISEHERPVSALQQPEWLTAAWIKLQTGQESEAVKLLESLLLLAEEQNRRRDVIRVNALLACACYQVGKIDRSLSILLDTLVAAEEEGYLRSFVDLGPVMLEMLTKLQADNSEQHLIGAYIQRIIKTFPAETAAKLPAAEALLTPRELEILGLLADGLSYAQITDRLVITENTLKTHIKRIYSKLHANNRMQAVLNAQSLHIL